MRRQLPTGGTNHLTALWRCTFRFPRCPLVTPGSTRPRSEVTARGKAQETRRRVGLKYFFSVSEPSYNFNQLYVETLIMVKNYKLPMVS